MATKDFSNKQEQMVADTLGWHKVAASGAAMGVVGDVISEKFLGECKTHVERSKKITFRQDVWKKLCNECISAGRNPVLIVDNGTQQDFNTYCITRLLPDMSCLPKGEFNVVEYNLNYQKQLNFDIQKLEKKIHKKYNTIFIIDWCEPVLLMGLDTFNEFQIYA